MMVKVTLELDKLTLLISQPSLQMRQGLVWMKILEYYFQWVLKLKRISFLILTIYFYYLNEGNGDPCAGHVNAKVCKAFSWYAARFDFEENFGSALPTGSKIVIYIWRWAI